MKKYKMRILPLFEEDLNRIVDYISLQLENPSTAYSLVDDVIMKRLPYAESFERYPSKKERSLDYYRIYVKNYIIFSVTSLSVFALSIFIPTRKRRTSWGDFQLATELFFSAWHD